MLPRSDQAGSLRDQIRAEIRRSRAARPIERQRADDRLRDARVISLVSQLLDDPGPAGVVACYLSRPGEPGTLDLVAALADDYRVLAPKLGRRDDGCPRQPPREPEWAWFCGMNELVDGVFGIPDPAGPGLGAEALEQADVVIAAALCAGADGSRMGTGGGWFDRALPHRRAVVPVIVLLNDDEIRTVPTEPHDQPVDWLVTPTRTIRTAIAAGRSPY
ncbi:5-formyltetrahydrofolate cyclo-ligase [Brooklawnia sp.]|uniref:5-formyltetrahydrofolate cyclo-ligase n=1 Tax=Brooklawnia sp. TaxID=2699740 RepID=UPI00311FEFB8